MLACSLLLATRIPCNANEALAPAPPPPRFARYASSSGPPPPLSRGRKGPAFSQRDPRRSFIHGEARMRKSASLSTTRHLLFSSLIKEGRQNADRRRTNRRACARRALSGARTPVGVPPRLSPKGVSHPKGSASGQASWDAVCTGVTRLRLSQSREAPPTPVIMPGDMMPKPPGSGLQIRPRAPHPLHLTACLR
jgi:hypothetical protein